MTGEKQLTPPPVYWAQRKNLVYVKVGLEDCSKPTIKVEKNKLYFKGNGGTEKQDHEVTLEFFGEIKPEESKYQIQARGTEFVLIKADEKGPFWKRLLKDDRKHHWLKVDFNKWKDEDDSDDELGGPGGNDGDFESMIRQMGGLNEGGVPDLDDTEENESDDDLPDLENVS
ncbi:Protein wos2-like protein [Leptotrombidium deliense]|uniref:Protein wos2-like protein n=1 Tax=Leptotrombidium deliense TaxID=299467 RepID=A0A443S6N5_9ACAR|nr:Protein wos2-like protein [Leptotrombidium deliense]